MPRNFRLSHSWADATHEDRHIAELQRGPLHTDKHPLRAELGRNSYGGFYAWLRGWGYPAVRELPDFEKEPREAEDALDALVAKGYELVDPRHLIDVFDLFDEPVSQNEDSRDAAEAPTGCVASVPGDNGRDAEDALDPDYVCIGPGDSAHALVDEELVF